MSDLDVYRDRLGVPGRSALISRRSRALHLAHLRTVPFENASVLFGEPIELDPDGSCASSGSRDAAGSATSSTARSRVCSRSIGFEVDLLEARGHETEGRLGPRFDHLALRVTLDEPWLVDVGFGYSFVEPLRLVAGIEQADPIGAFRLVRSGTSWTSSGAIATAAGSRTTGWTRSRTRWPSSPRRPVPPDRPRVAVHARLELRDHGGPWRDDAVGAALHRHRRRRPRRA